MLKAGPGFGKTTLLSQTFSSSSVVWHTITASDASLPAFALNIVERLGLRVPGMDPDLRSALEGPTGPDLADDGSRVEALASAIAEELERRLKRDLILIIDDVQRLDPGGQSAQFMGALCRNAPSRLHIVTASRTDLPFPTARMTLSGDTDEMTSADLAFTADEVAQLTADLEGASDPSSVSNLMVRTNGWPAAVMMTLRSRPLSAETGSGDALDAVLDYLEEELFSSETPETLDGLAVAAELPWISADLLKHLNIYSEALDPSRSEDAHSYLSRQPDSPNTAAVAPIIAEFLQRRSPLGGNRRKEILINAARWYATNGFYGEALNCHTAAGTSTETSRLLIERGQAMLSSGLARQLLEVIELLDSEEKTDDLLILEAEVRQVLGDWEGAAGVYRDLVPDTFEMPPALAWRLGFLQHMRGDVNGAVASYQRGQLGTGDLANESALLGWLASAHWLRGERDQAKLLADQALGLALQAGDSKAFATAHTVLAMVAALDGDRAANDIHYLRALEHAERARDVLQTIRIRSNRGSRFLEEGDLGAALEEIEIALRLADMTGFELWRGMALTNRAQISSLQGRLEEAISDLKQARAIFRSIGSSLEAYPMAHLGMTYSVRGDTTVAMASFEEAIRIADDQSDIQALVPALTGLARLVAAEDPERAKKLARRASRLNSVLGRVAALLALAEAALAEENVESASKLAEEASQVARARNDLPGLAEALEISARTTSDRAQAIHLLDQARQVWTDVGSPLGTARVDVLIAERTDGATALALAASAAESLELLGAKGPALHARRVIGKLSSSESQKVSIRTLGGFEVVVDGNLVPGSAWQSRVAREILCMLVANRSRPIHREVLTERLWPDEDLAKSANRLSVALATIRRVLSPDRTDGDSYVRSDRDVVALSSDLLNIDVERFLADATEGRSMIRTGRTAHGLALLASAEARYVGDFLEDQPYAEWAVALREDARSVYVDITSTLAAADVERGDYDSAARRYLRILERDSYNETAHLDLVRVMSSSGRHGTARRLYSIYVSRMAELDVEPRAFPS